MKVIQFVLLPASLCYGFMMMIRNLLFDMGVLPRKSFEVPVISIGNLSLGGTGKTPHIEYLIRLLKDCCRIATLSRGYGRESKGFQLATNEADVKAIGDEPLQYFRKYNKIKVAVDEKRTHGIRELLDTFPDLNAVL